MGNAFKLLLLLIFILFAQHSEAISYLPNRTKVLFTEIDGWVKGEVLDKSYKKVNDSEVLSVLSISIDEFSGISNAQITNMKNFKVHYPGGKWQGVNITYSGSPSLEVGETYYFLLKKKKGGFFVNGLGAGVIKDISANMMLIDELKDFSEKKFNKIHFSKIHRINKSIGNLQKKRMPAASPGGAKSVKLENQGDFSTTVVVFIIVLLMFIYLLLGRNENSKK